MLRLLRSCGCLTDVTLSVDNNALLCSVRGLRTHTRLQCKEKKPEEPIPGIPYKKLVVGVPKESWQNERRVALTPAVTELLVKKGFRVVVEENAGVLANFPNDGYAAAGGSVKPIKDVYRDSDIILRVRPPTNVDVPSFRDRSSLISLLFPAQNKDVVDALAKKQMTAFAMDCIPRISRAQVFDALSSMANIAGYRSVVEAAHQFGRFFAGLV